MITVYEKLIQLRDIKGFSNKQVASGTHYSLSTINRVFSTKFEDHKRGHSVDVIIAVVNFLGGDFDEIFVDSGTIMGGRNFNELHERINVLTVENKDLLDENIMLKAELTALRNELLHTQIAHKDEIIELYKLMHNQKNNGMEA